MYMTMQFVFANFKIQHLQLLPLKHMHKICYVTQYNQKCTATHNTNTTAHSISMIKLNFPQLQPKNPILTFTPSALIHLNTF